MSNFVNKVKTRDGIQYEIHDARIPSIKEANDKDVIVVQKDLSLACKPWPGDALTSVFNKDIEDITISEPVSKIPESLFENIPSLTTVSFGDIDGDIEQRAFYGDENIIEINLGKINGKIGAFAFAGLINVEDFYIDPESCITEIGQCAFAALSSNTLDNCKKKVFDFRNSTFKTFGGFGLPDKGESHFDSESSSNIWEVVEEGLGLHNADIYLPETVDSFGYEYMGGTSRGISSTNVLDNSSNVDLFIGGKDVVIPLQNVNVIPDDEKSHIYVPLEIFGRYSLATNWAAYDNLRVYTQLSKNVYLPTYDEEGYEVKWFSDKELTNPLVRSNGKMVYGIHSGTRLFSKVIIEDTYQGTVTISDGVRTYEPGELIEVGTEITITPVYTGDEQEQNLIKFSLNDEPYDSAVTFMLGEDNIYVKLMFNVKQLPSYFLLAKYRSWSWAYNPAVANTYELRKSSSIPSDITKLVIDPYYIYNGEVYAITYIDSSTLRNTPTLKEIILPETLQIDSFSWGFFSGDSSLEKVNFPSNIKSIGEQAFYNCTSLHTLIIPQRVNYVAPQAFGGCTGLEAVYYEGTVNDLTIRFYNGSYGSESNQHFKDVLYYYSETKPESAEIPSWHYVNGEPVIWEI